MEAVCPSCGASPVSGKFCSECGASLATACPSCGASPVSGKFCSECGSDLGSTGAAPRATPPGAGPVAERRVCSLLFVDLVGFTPLSESRDPEAVRELLSRYFELARTVVARYGGVIEKFIGDAVMAVWGAPVATEGDAERAVRAALELVEAVAQLGIDDGIPGLQARAGLVTGEVAVTIGAVGEGMVAGDPVNTAARVQSVADPGHVFADDATRRLAAAGIGFDDAGEFVLKGKAEPVTLFRATRVLSGVGGAQRVDGLEAPLIGRDAELRLVKELFHASIERATPRLVVVSGPAGVGKSRLGWEFEKYIDGLADAVWWHRGRCLSYGDGIAYWALAEMVRQRFGIADEDPLEVVAAKLADQLPQFVPDPAERSVVEPRLARLLGVSVEAPDAAAVSRAELFIGWQLFFERLAGDGTVVMLVEDGQHADPALLDFFDQLVDQAAQPIYIVLFTRPELAERRAELGVGRNRTHLSLDPLDDRSMTAMLDALVPGMPSDAVAAIASHTQGNPLFAIETVRSLIDRDVVVPRDGEYRLVGDVGSLQVPDSLHGLLAARLDALSPQLRALVADAAVLGTSFPADALIGVSGRPADEVATALEELVRRDIVAISNDPLSPQRGGYVFRQNMLRQVAYDTLSRRDRKSRHLAVAAHLRATFDGDEIMEVVAQHYRDALEAVSDDADTAEIGAQAVTALVRAAERALQIGAPGRAGDNFAAAAELTRTLDSTALAAAGNLWVRSAQVTRTAADFPLMRRRADAAAEAYAECGDERGEALAHVQAGVALSFLGRITEARPMLTAGTEVLRRVTDLDTIKAVRELAVLEIFDGGAEGSALIEEALDLAQEVDAPDATFADLFQVRGTAYMFADQPIRSVAMYRHAIHLAQRSGAKSSLLRALINMSDTYLGFDAAESARCAWEGFELASATGDRAGAAIGLANGVFAEILAGNWDRADDALAAAMARWPGLPDVSMMTAFLAALRGDAEGAERAGPDLQTYRSSEDAQDQTTAFIVDAFSALAQNRGADALREFQRIIELAAILGLATGTNLIAWPAAMRTAAELGDNEAVRALLADLDARPIGQVPRLLRAERALARAKLDSDGAGLVAALAQVRELDSPYHVAHALLDLATAPDAPGEDRDALLAEADAIAARLRCRPLADRVAAARAVAVR